MLEKNHICSTGKVQKGYVRVCGGEGPYLETKYMWRVERVEKRWINFFILEFAPLYGSAHLMKLSSRNTTE